MTEKEQLHEVEKNCSVSNTESKGTDFFLREESISFLGAEKFHMFLRTQVKAKTIT